LKRKKCHWLLLICKKEEDDEDDPSPHSPRNVGDYIAGFTIDRKSQIVKAVKVYDISFMLKSY